MIKLLASQEENAARKTALEAAKLLHEKKVQDMVLLEVSKLTYVADYFLIGTGTSDLQVQAMADHLKESFKKQGYNLLRLEGYREARWVLLDYGDLVVHLFQPEERDFYNLERLWDGAPRVEEVNTAG